jgi:CRP/FNR family transcriptional regulator, cyclic AMP receptor protein
MDLPPVEGSLLSYISAADRDLLMSAGVRRRFVENELMLHQGDPSDHVFLLMAGWVRVYAITADGQENMIALRGPGDLVGELAAINGWDRTASVQSLTPVHVVQLLRTAFVDCVYANPAIAVGLIKQLSARLREVEAILLEVNTLDVSRRVATYLLHLASRHGAPGPDGVALGMPLSQQDIAGRVGASLRGVARALALLRDRGIIFTNRKQIVIVRPDVLRSFASNNTPDVI